MATGTRFPDQLADPLPVADSSANTTLDEILTALGTRAAQENGGHIAAIDANTTGAAKESGGHLASADTRLGTIATAVGGAARESGGNLDAIAASVAIGAHESGGHLEAVDTNTAAIEGHAASLDTKASQVLTRLADGTQTTQISGTPTVNIGTAPNLTVGSSALPTGAAKDSTLTDGTQRTQITGTPTVNIGTAPNLTVGSSALPTGAAKDSTLTDGTQRTQISGTPTVNIGTAPNLTVGSSALPTGAATEATLLAVKNAVLAQIALSDLIVQDSASNLFVRRETVTDAGVVTVTFTDLAGNPAVPVPPLALANSDTKRHVEDYLYDAVNAGTGYSVSDVIARIVVIDDTTATDLVINSAWMNLTAGTMLTTPPVIADLRQQNKDIAVLSSALPTGAAKDSTLTDGTQRTQITGTPTVNIGTAPSLTVGSSVLPTGAAQETGGNLATIATQSALIARESGGHLQGVDTNTGTTATQTTAIAASMVTNTANTGAIATGIGAKTDAKATDGATASSWSVVSLLKGAVDSLLSIVTNTNAGAKETGGNLATIAAGVGTKTNASVMPAGGVGQIGWLSAIVAAISQGVSVFLPSATTVVGAAALTSASTVNTDIFTNTVGGYLDVSGYRSVSLTITGTGSFTGGALQFGQTNDLAVSGTNNCFLNSGAAIKTADPVSGVIPTTTTFLYEGPITAKYFTIRNGVVWGNTGSITVTAVFSTMPYSSSRWTVGNATASNLVTMPGVGTAANSTTAFRSISVVATGVSVKSGVGRLYQLQITNLKNATIFFKLYNKASAATVGTDTPFQTFAVPAGQTLTLDWMYGLPFSLGLSYAATTLPGDADATAPAANEVLINGQYA